MFEFDLDLMKKYLYKYFFYSNIVDVLIDSNTFFDNFKDTIILDIKYKDKNINTPTQIYKNKYKLYERRYKLNKLINKLK